MKLTIVIENIKDASKKTKQAMFVTYRDSKGTPVTAVSEIPKGSAFADELVDIMTQMKKLHKDNKKKK